MQSVHTKSKERGGFTLIELLVVIAIIGILSAVVLTSLNSARGRARDARRIADLRQIQNGLELYAQANGNLYFTPSATADTASTKAAFVALVTALKAGGYMQGPTVDPLNQSSYYYRYDVSKDGLKYHIGALLENANNALNNDSDADSTDSSSASGWLITGFKGNSVDCGSTVTPSGSTELCYDQTP